MELAEVLAGIEKHRELLHTKQLWNNSVGLSEEMTKIATYNSLLADHIAPLHKSATDKAHSIFLECRTTKQPDGKVMGITEAEQMAKGESTSERETYEQALFVYRATSSLINIIQSRLKVIMKQLEQESI